jgi:folate-binding protein YgfZ
MTKLIQLTDRCLLEISGADSAEFLQGLITNDIHKVEEGKAIFAALLNPQGRFLYDFFIIPYQEKFLIDIASSEAASFKQRLLMYKLRSDVQIVEFADFEVLSLSGADMEGLLAIQQEGEVKTVPEGICFVDPRNRNMGLRVFVQKEKLAEFSNKHASETGDITDYTLLRYMHKIAAGEQDLLQDKSFILEYCYNELQAIDFDKGCYVGQEMITRTFHRGVIRKAIYRFEIDGSAELEKGAEVMSSEKKLGQICSFIKSGEKVIGLALLRKEEFAAIDKEKIFVGEVVVKIE